MALSGTSDLYIVELVIYVLLLPFVMRLGRLHRSTGSLGYLFLTSTCGIRIAADIVSLLPANRNATQPTIATAILSSIGLSPLLLAVGGFLHEAHVRLTEVKQGAGRVMQTKRLLWAVQILIHVITVLGLVLIIIGTVHLIQAESNPNSANIGQDNTLRSVGGVMLLVVWVFLVHYALYLVYFSRDVRTSSASGSSLRKMVYWICLSLPFVGLRAVFSVLYAFDHNNASLNPVTGALWVKVVFLFLASLGAVVALCISGWVSRNASEIASLEQYASSHQKFNPAMGGRV